jgi:hypothetical protein
LEKLTKFDRILCAGYSWNSIARFRREWALDPRKIAHIIGRRRSLSSTENEGDMSDDTGGSQTSTPGKVIGCS